MAQQVSRGGLIRLEATFTDGVGTLVDPDTPQVDILDPVGTAAVTDAVPTRETTGRYHYDYTVDVAAATGTWTAHWTGTVDGAPVSADDRFDVVGTGTINVTEDVLVSPREVAAAAEVDLDVDQLEALRTLIGDWTGQLEARLNRPLLIRTYMNETVTLAPGSDSLWLRHAPIREVLEVRTTTGTYTGTYTADGGRIKLAGGLSPTGGDGQTFYVDYRAGLSADEARVAKAVVKERAMRMAVKLADKAVGVRDLTQEGYAAPFLDEGWTDQELENVSRLRRRVVRT